MSKELAGEQDQLPIEDPGSALRAQVVSVHASIEIIAPELSEHPRIIGAMR